MDLRFRDHILDLNKPPILIAEAGVSHFGSLDRAYRLINLAKQSGCKTVKFQHFSVSELISEVDTEWRNRLKGRDTTKEFITKIYEYAKKSKIHCFFTPHTEKALNELISIGSKDVIKVGSGERGNNQFIRKILDKGAFVLISTGTYLDDDLLELRNLLKDYPPNSACILHCNTTYPTPFEEVNLKTIEYLQTFFKGIASVGYSDHTEGTAIPLSSVVLGVRVIEKHISLEKNIPNAQDWKVSCFEDDLPILVKSIDQVWASSNKKVIKKIISKDETNNREWANKSCYLVKDLLPKSRLTKDLYKAQRPFSGMSPNQVETNLLGKIYNGSETLRKGYSFKKKDVDLFD